MNRAYILIDCWPTIRNDIVGNIIRTINQDANDIVINANYNHFREIHPVLAEALKRRPYYQLRDNIEQLTSLLVKHRITQVCIMGGHWPACTHHSAFGLYALQRLKATIPFEIIVYPQCLVSYDSGNPIANDELNGWFMQDVYYQLLKTTPPLA
jgi:hypothetical protein